MDNYSHPVSESQENEGLGGPAMRARSFGELCRKAGLADTPQRRLIYRCLAESSDHPTVETVFNRVRPHLPRVSLATVYRNLKIFVGAGLIDEVAIGGNRARYDADRSPHHHLICESCGEVADHHSDSLDCIECVGPGGNTVGGFEVHRSRVNLFGLCAKCREMTATETGV